jgi:GTPase SAR1 family protein
LLEIFNKSSLLTSFEVVVVVLKKRAGKFKLHTLLCFSPCWRFLTKVHYLPGVSMSTVGVDIGDWTFEKRDRSGPSGSATAGQGPVVFRTWDFGGQTEYYATHQYFLSKRSLYIVVWNIMDGEKGMNT